MARVVLGGPVCPCRPWRNADARHFAPNRILTAYSLFAPKKVISGNFTFGNESRSDNVLRGPGTANWDISLFKDVPVHETMKLSFRLEAFNVFNRVQFGNPNSTVGAPRSAGSRVSTTTRDSSRFQDASRFRPRRESLSRESLDRGAHHEVSNGSYLRKISLTLLCSDSQN